MKKHHELIQFLRTEADAAQYVRTIGKITTASSTGGNLLDHYINQLIKASEIIEELSPDLPEVSKG